ncbi:hypothetical protein DSL64_25340 [Dyadobacter luteus]|uniref:Uncharacterized protein n=1 Tax=Dyadobacter luteus TaxID=2259619 RepID=A0A3D8Y409_9BACT|nr:hypothetical protein [Dyadobacter luteus]REA56980.1 hypothetical protein DSL64_25340 [Dyadobacter luteus]
MKKFILSALSAGLLLVGCSKDSPDSPVPVATPPVEEITYQYMLVNVSSDTLVTFNNDPKKPKENYPEILLLPKGKVMVKVGSESGISPMIKTKNPLLQTQVTIDNTGKIYELNAYLNEAEFYFSGDVLLVNIFFLNPETGKADSLKGVTLPRSIYYKKAPEDVIVTAEKQKVKGSLSVRTTLTGNLTYTKSTNAAFGRITSKTSVKSKAVTHDVKEPEEWPCGTHAGNTLITGERGGCYYINKNGNKTYVDRSECNCD